MSETKSRPESSYSGERIAVTGSDSVRGEKATAIAERADQDASAKTTGNEVSAAGKHAASDTPSPAKRVDNQEDGAASSATKSAPTTVTSHVQRGDEPSPLADLGQFLKRTWLVWAIIVGTILGGMALVTVQKGMAERARIAKEARQEHAVATVTVDTLLARCGAAADDVTKDMYPMILRTMTYQPRENERVVFQFSRTAEEKSEWVFLSMKDGSGTKNYDTTQAKIAALPCLDLKR
jgi:hypothetical protein